MSSPAAPPLIGILGGAGHWAAHELMHRVLTAAAQSADDPARDDAYPALIIHDVALTGMSPNGPNDTQLLAASVELAIDRLHAAGCTWIVPACNSISKLAARAAARRGLGCSNLVRETAARAMGDEPVTVLAASSMIQLGLYQRALHGRAIIPAADVQDRVDSLISMGIAGNRQPLLMQKLLTDVGGSIILGCTELGLHLNATQDHVFDSLQVAADIILERSAHARV